MEEALMSYDGCSGLVGGFYGEFSKDVDRLIKTIFGADQPRCSGGSGTSRCQVRA